MWATVWTWSGQNLIFIFKGQQRVPSQWTIASVFCMCVLFPMRSLHAAPTEKHKITYWSYARVTDSIAHTVSWGNPYQFLRLLNKAAGVKGHQGLKIDPEVTQANWVAAGNPENMDKHRDVESAMYKLSWDRRAEVQRAGSRAGVRGQDSF